MVRLFVVLFFALSFTLATPGFGYISPGPSIFIVVADNRVIGKYKRISDAKAALRVYKKGARTPKRMIVEAKGGRVDEDPRFVGGEEQQAGLRNGFNIWWSGWKDIDVMLNVAQISLGDTRGFFLSVTDTKVLGQFNSLSKAKQALLRFKNQRRPSRMVVEVQDGKVLDDPRRVGGQNQLAGMVTGFNRFWRDWDDVDEMLWVAEDYLYRKKNLDTYGVFIVVINRKVVGKFDRLSLAKQALKKYPVNRPPSRCVVEVIHNRVHSDPRMIAGRDQEAGITHGFNRYWTGWSDIDKMVRAAEEYLYMEAKDVKGTFIVVAERKVIDIFKLLSNAKAALKKYKLGAKSPSRMVVEVKNGRLLDDPRIIAGQPQIRGMRAGFNTFWKGWNDIDGMLAIAEKFLHSSGNVKGVFIVVGGGKVLGKFMNLAYAKKVLNEYGKRNVLQSRMIVEVINGKVKDDPRTCGGQDQSRGISAGFNKRWTGWPDIDAMLLVAEKYLSGVTIGDTVDIIFVVVAKLKVVGHYRTIEEAKEALRVFKSGSKAISRVVFEVKNGAINPDISIVGGQRQIDGLTAGFNVYWKNRRDIAAMFKTCVVYVLKLYPNGPNLTSGDVRGDFVVVAAGKVIMRVALLSKAKAALRRWPEGARSPNRCIVEVAAGVVKKTILIIGGQRQVDGLKAGFNKMWHKSSDIWDMISIAKKYVEGSAPLPVPTDGSLSPTFSPIPISTPSTSSEPTYSPLPTSQPGPTIMPLSSIKPIPTPTPPSLPAVDPMGMFLMIANMKVSGMFSRLSQAKRALSKYPRGYPNPSRMIVEVRNGRVVPNVYTIRGQRQVDGLKAGFNKWWWNKLDIQKMLKVARQYIKTSQPTPIDVRGVFLVIVYKRVIGEYYYLSKAKEKLSSFPVQRPPLRCIVEVKNGRVIPNINMLGNERQIDGMKFGFNIYWRNIADVRHLILVAQRYWRVKYGLPKPPAEVRGMFIVVVGTKVIRKFTLLSRAKAVLARYKRDVRKPSRCVFEVRKGKVISDPRIIGGQRQSAEYGFNMWWWDWWDINRMFKIAVEFYTNVPSSGPVDAKVTFIVVVGNKVAGKFNRIKLAIAVLNKVKLGASKPSRCIFEIRNGKVQPDPHIIGGHRQGQGLKVGFNKWWWDWWDINRMFRIATMYMNVKA